MAHIAHENMCMRLGVSRRASALLMAQMTQRKYEVRVTSGWHRMHTECGFYVGSGWCRLHGEQGLDEWGDYDF